MAAIDVRYYQSGVKHSLQIGRFSSPSQILQKLEDLKKLKGLTLPSNGNARSPDVEV